MNDSEMALAALLKAAQGETGVSTELLRKTFAIQSRHQFDRDETREASLLELKSLLDAVIDEEAPK